MLYEISIRFFSKPGIIFSYFLLKLIITSGPLWFPGALQKSFVKAKISSMMFSVGINVDESAQVAACDEISVMLLL